MTAENCAERERIPGSAQDDTSRLKCGSSNVRWWPVCKDTVVGQRHPSIPVPHLDHSHRRHIRLKHVPVRWFCKGGIGYMYNTSPANPG